MYFWFKFIYTCLDINTKVLSYDAIVARFYKYFQIVTLPKSNETGLGESITKEVNCAVERVLKKQNGGLTRKRKYKHFSP